ncbi:MAG: NAD(P)-dependent oxidoreductase, partial [candidate division NC10 bacterium]|nr:NAD(P)-dependent oxidoreductase [candidate division NC10 bacterium]
MTYLITGAHGFIGTHLTRECLQAGIRVIAYDLVRPRRPEPGLEGAVAVEGDILEPTKLIETMQVHQVQAVIHLATYGAGEVGREIGLVKAGDYNPLKGAEVNVLGALNVFEAARLAGVRRVVYASSIAVYGPPSIYGEKTPDEDAPLRPQTLYGAAKAMVEVAAEVYRRRHGLEVIGLRPTFVYGPGRWYRGTVPFVVDLFEGALAGRSVRIEAADVMWDMVYVKDAAHAFFLAAQVTTPEH